MTSHFSLNIKTLSSHSNAQVLSLALVHFDEDKILNSMHLQLTLEGQSTRKRHVETSRVHWWFNEYAKQDGILPLGGSIVDPGDAIKAINKFIVANGSVPANPETPVNFIWMRGIQFDYAILENLSHDFGVGLSFRHNALRDQRTFCDGHVDHNPIKARCALYDAMYHAFQIRKTLKITDTELK
tara:strand:- start:35647 stop:36198 length:552 start_codon:yes stop_codon:yes gene_type:complete